MKITKNYFDGDISPGFISLYSSKSIIRISASLLGMFLPVFLYQYFKENFYWVAIYYLIGSFIYVLTIPEGAILMNRFGFRRALRLGSILGALYYAILYWAPQLNPFWFVTISLTVLTFYRLFHWIPYRVDFAKFTDEKNRAKEVGLLSATANVVGVIAPFVAGIILSKYDFNALFLLVVIIYILSLIPLVAIPHTHEKFSWTYIKTWRKLFSQKFIQGTGAYIADGAENAIGVVVWPIFMYNLLKGNYLEMGFVAALITGVTIILQLTVGKLADKKSVKDKFIKYGSIFYSAGWIIKVFIATALQIFLVDAYHKLMKIFLRIPFDALVYETAAHQGHFVDEFTVIHEMALHLGKILMLILVMITYYYLGINWTFILAALASVLFNLARSHEYETSS